MRLYGLLLIPLLIGACVPSTATDVAQLAEAPLGMPTRAVTATPTLTLTVTPRPTDTPTALPTPVPTATPTPVPTSTATPTATPALSPTPVVAEISAFAHAFPTATPTPLLGRTDVPGTHGHPTLADFWAGTAQFVIDVPDTGLPLGESDTLVMRNGELWSYLHTSTPASGVLDRCGSPVPFPGCTVIYRSTDGGRSFHPDSPLVCQFDCAACPCVSERDHTDQQQYPRVAYNGTTLFLAYEYRGRVRLRRSIDGLTWSAPEKVADTGIWKLWLRTCRQEERIGPHPFVPYEYECLAGGPPGIFVEGSRVYIFVGLGQNPGSMGCYVGSVTTPAAQFTRCTNNPLFTGATQYGPPEERGPQTNAYFDFRTISSAEVVKVGERIYMLYEGVRGPGPGDPGDRQFGLGLARSLTGQIDGPWETYPGSPILVDLPGNVGVGHADVIVLQGQTLLYTSLDGRTRSRLALVWK